MNDLEHRRRRRIGASGYETTASDLRQVILPPEQVELHLPIAGPTSRVLAYAIDYFLLILVELGLFAILLLSTQAADRILELIASAITDDVRPEDVEQFFRSSAMFYFLAGVVLISFAIELVYFTLWEVVWSGGSLGKNLMHLRVVGDRGAPPTMRESMTRNLLRVVDMLPMSYLAGLASMLLSPQGKRLGDIAAGTVVIRLDRPQAPPPLPEPDGAPASFPFERDQLTRLTDLDRQLVLQTLRRLESLPPEHVAPLRSRTVKIIRARIGYAEVPVEEERAFLLALLRATEHR